MTGRSHIFSLTPAPHARRYLFQCASAEERDLWLNQITKALAELPDADDDTGFLSSQTKARKKHRLIARCYIILQPYQNRRVRVPRVLISRLINARSTFSKIGLGKGAQVRVASP